MLIFLNISNDMKNRTIFQKTEFLPYFVIGGMATSLDWFIFWVLVTFFHWHYELSLVIGFVIAGIFHFAANKFFTFECHSKKIGSQYFLHIFVTMMGLILSMAMIAFFVNILLFEKMWARILTTALLLFPNYLLHKFITFNKKIFIQPA